MRADDARARGRENESRPAPGGSVEPAKRAELAKALFQTPDDPVAERYELRDALTDLTYRANSRADIIAKAEHVGADRKLSQVNDLPCCNSVQQRKRSDHHGHDWQDPAFAWPEEQVRARDRAVSGGIAGGATVGAVFGGTALAFIPVLGVIIVASSVAAGAAAGQAVESRGRTLDYPELISIPMTCPAAGATAAARP